MKLYGAAGGVEVDAEVVRTDSPIPWRWRITWPDRELRGYEATRSAAERAVKREYARVLRTLARGETP